MADAIRGIEAEVSPSEVKKQQAYVAGLRIRQMNREQILPQINKQMTGRADTTYLDLGIYTRALTASLAGQKGNLTQEEAFKILERQNQYYLGTVRQSNTAYLEANAKEKGVKTTDSGLQYKVLTKGTGALPTDTSEVEVNYEGRLIDGTVFDSSYKRGKSATFRVNQVIQGWQEALKLMPVGSVWELYIPFNLAYGERGTRDIPPYSTSCLRLSCWAWAKPRRRVSPDVSLWEISPFIPPVSSARAVTGHKRRCSIVCGAFLCLGRAAR